VKRLDLQSNLAMTVTITGLSMFFATLMMGYAIYRSSSTFWPPMGFSKVSLTVPSISTFLILLSSWFCYQIKGNVKARDLKKARLNLNLTLLLGIGFMITQSLFWSELNASGLYVNSGIFASILYGFTWIHAAHVVAGIMTLVYLSFVLKPTDDRLLIKAINVEKFWHFLGVIWLMMFITLFVY
jgi:cytochrome c oxidase subunit III